MKPNLANVATYMSPHAFTLDRFVKKSSLVDVRRSSPWEEQRWEGIPKIQAYHSLKVIIEYYDIPAQDITGQSSILMTIF